ncbi:ATP-binding protein [Litorimonas sp.]|uniref:ATP-binding protein n=1 Tax=Litorimonas sp. TaxID=1892381 RepID=UPI003A8C3193
MNYRHLFRFKSIRNRLLMVFGALCALISVLCFYSLYSLHQVDREIEAGYLRPHQMMILSREAGENFSRANSLIMTEMAREAQGAAIYHTGLKESIENINTSLSELDKFSMDSEDRKVIQETKENIQLWSSFISDGPRFYDFEKMRVLTELSKKIFINFENIMLSHSNEMAVSQAKASQHIDVMRIITACAVIFSLFFSAISLFWLTKAIINPLQLASKVAGTISEGNFDAKIPKGGADETGEVLRSMTIMQAKIRSRFEIEKVAKLQAQDHLNNALEQSQDAVLITDKDGKIVTSNHKVGDLFVHLNQKPLTGKALSEFFLPDGRPIMENISAITESREFSFGENRWARLNATQSANGGQIFIWTDMSPEHRREENLRRAIANAQAAEVARTQFLATMSHELRTPLNAVIGFSDAMSRETFGPHNAPQYKELSEKILESGESLLEMINDMLIVADNREEEEIEVVKTEVCVNEMIEKVIQEFQSRIEEKSIRLNWQPVHTDSSFATDISKFEHVLKCVMSNAVKFNKNNGLIKIIPKREEDRMSISIIDSGVGIATEKMASIFKPLEQSDSSYSRAFGGAGLGLTVAKRWMNVLNGNLLITSQLGKGTLVKLVLPTTNNSIKGSTIEETRKARSLPALTDHAA